MNSIFFIQQAAFTHWGFDPPCGIGKEHMAFAYVNECKKDIEKVDCPICKETAIKDEPANE